MDPEGTMRDDGGGAAGATDARRRRGVISEDRYQPYRRAPRKARRGGRTPVSGHRAGRGLRLHHFGPSKAPTNGRRLFLLVVLLGVTLWGAVAVRRGDVDLDRLDEQAVEVVQAVPGLLSDGRARVTALYRSLRPQDDPDALGPKPPSPSVE